MATMEARTFAQLKIIGTLTSRPASGSRRSLSASAAPASAAAGNTKWWKNMIIPSGLADNSSPWIGIDGRSSSTHVISTSAASTRIARWTFSQAAKSRANSGNYRRERELGADEGLSEAQQCSVVPVFSEDILHAGQRVEKF